MQNQVIFKRGELSDFSFGSSTTTYQSNKNNSSTNPIIPDPSGLIPVPIPFSTTIPFNEILSAMPLHTVVAALNFTPNTTTAVEGGGAILSLKASGNATQIPTFTGMTALSGTSPYDNRANAINVVQFIRAGGLYLYQIGQPADGAIIDTTPPAFINATINGAGSTILLNLSEPLLTSSIPPVSAFTSTSGTVSAVGIAGQVVTLTMSPVVPAGGSTVITYSGTLLKDTAGNSAAGFSTASLAVANSAVLINLDSRGSGLAQPTAGNYVGSGAVNAVLVFGATGNQGHTSTTVLTGDFRIIAEPTNTPQSTSNLFLSVADTLPTSRAGQALAGLEIAYVAAPYADSYNSGVKNSAAATGLLNNDTVSITRTSTVTRAQKRAFGSVVWVDLFTFATTTTAPLYIQAGASGTTAFALSKVAI